MIYNKYKIAIIGLGYVGLPLSIAFSQKFKTIGFDVNISRVNELKIAKDINKEFSSNNLVNKNLYFTSRINEISESNVFILTLPTPINKNNTPNLKPLIKGVTSITKFIKKNDIIIIESTVYPGLTEEISKIIEKKTKLILNKDFFMGYSPERINPGDKVHNIYNIKKVVSGSNTKTAKILKHLYSAIIKAGVHVTPNIKTAEAAKVIENTQRDLNIALVNEFSLIFNKLNIDTKEVLKAASTKWNFNNFTPGLVGGHCIGIDPYYLTYIAKKIGYDPKVILAGRKINNEMTKYIVKNLKNILKQKSICSSKINVLILGYTFKENCSDIRNTKVLSLVNNLKLEKYNVHIYDPLVEINKKNFIKKPKNNFYNMIILAVPHKEFISLGILKLKKFAQKKHVFADLKSIFNSKYSDFRL